MAQEAVVVNMRVAHPGKAWSWRSSLCTAETGTRRHAVSAVSPAATRHVALLLLVICQAARMLMGVREARPPAL